MLDDIGKQPLDVVGKTLNRGQIGLLCSVVHGGGGEWGTGTAAALSRD